MGQICSATSNCCCPKVNLHDEVSEPLFAKNEREAVSALLSYFENKEITNFFEGEPLDALRVLAQSDNRDLQRSAGLAFAEVTEPETPEVSLEVLDVLFRLIQTSDLETQRAATAALGNLAVNHINKVQIVRAGFLNNLVHLMASKSAEVQCNAVGCITNLATHDENKEAIANSGALYSLLKLAKQKDIRIQRNAAGAILNMTHSYKDRLILVSAGALPLLVSLLNSTDLDLLYYCTTAISNLAVDETTRSHLYESEPQVTSFLINILDSQIPKIQYQVCLALRNLASESQYQLDIVKYHGLTSLLKIMSSPIPLNVLAAIACIRNVSIHPNNEIPIVEIGFLPHLIDMISMSDNSEIQCHAISTLRNLIATSEANKTLIMEAGAIEKFESISVSSSPEIQSEIAACLAVLALSSQGKARLLEEKVMSMLLRFTQSPDVEVQGNSAAALGNLASKAPNYSIFCKWWNEPNGGISQFLELYLTSTNPIFCQIAIWTTLQLLDSKNEQLTNLLVGDITFREIILHISENQNDHKTHQNSDQNAKSESAKLAMKCYKYFQDTEN